MVSWSNGWLPSFYLLLWETERMSQILRTLGSKGVGGSILAAVGYRSLVEQWHVFIEGLRVLIGIGKKRSVDIQKGRANLASLAKSLSQTTRCFRGSLLIEWQDPSPDVGSSPAKAHEQKHILIRFFFSWDRISCIPGRFQIQHTAEGNIGGLGSSRVLGL